MAMWTSVRQTTIQDLANDLSDTLVKRNSKGAIIAGGYLFEKVAVQGFFAGLREDGRNDDETTMLMTPYLEAYYAAQEATNEALKRLARATKVKAVVAKHSFSLSKTVRRCNDACIHATGDTCTCGCGGANHGMGFFNFVQNPIEKVA